MKNLVFNLRTAKAQAEGCAKVTKSSRMAKILTTLTLLLTLGVGQMWADNGDFYNASMSYKFGDADWAWIQDSDNGTGMSRDLGTLSSGTFKVGDVYLLCWDDWGANFKSSGGQMCYTNKGSGTQYLTGFTRSGKDGNNYNYYKTGADLTIANATDASGSYSLVCWYQTWGWGDRFFPKSSGNYTLNYNIAPPAVSGFGVSASGFLAGSGTSEDPYLVASGSTLRLTASGSQAHSDANSSVNYKFGSAAYSTTATKNITVSSSGSIAVKARCINSSASLNGTETSTTTIYYAPVSVKDISVYIYVGGRTSAEINSVEMNGCTPYVGTKALSSVKINNQSAGAPKFTLSGNWLIYTFTNVTKVSNITCARSGGNIFSGEITDNVYYSYDGTSLPSQCVPRANPTWGTAPASGAIGGSMTATVSGAPAGATITWSSTNTSAATVNSSGVISYEATGNTTIKANVSWSASGDYCAGSYELSQAISVTSGATVSATRTSPEYVAAGVNGQVSMHITFTGTSSGWKYRVKHNWDAGYETGWLDASGTSADWTMTGGMSAGTFAYVVELYNSEGGTLITTSSPVSVTGETAFNTTIAAGSNGSVSPSGTVYANNNHVHPSITATPNEHYNFVNWTSNNAAASVASSTSATTTVTATSGGYTITANFAGDQYTITYKDQGGSAFSGTQTSAPTTHTYGTATTLKIPTKTGYTFNGWFTVQDCSSGQVGTASAASLSATGYTSNITLYAKWTEIMSDLSTSCHYDVGNPGYAVPTKSVSSIGIATTSTLTATAAGTGYTFAGWTLSSNVVVTNGDAATDRTITVRTNGNGAAATAQANYTEDLSSPWIVAGGNKIVTTGTPWRTTADANNTMLKKTGHSTESVAYFYVTVTATNTGATNSNYQFKLYNTKTSAYHGLSGDGQYYLLRAESGTQKNLTSPGINIELRADVAGTYEIKVDYSTATPKITVTFPTKYTVTYSVSPSGAANAITTSPSVSSGGYVAAGTSVTFTHAAAKTGYRWYRWENGSGSSLGTESTYTTTINANTTVVAKYTENTYNVTATASAGGSATPTSATAMGQITGGDITASPNTGYNFTNWTITSGSGYFGASGSASTSTTANTKFRPTAAATIQANFTPKTTTITLNNHDATTPGSTSVTATYDAAMPAITLPTKTGYTFGGYWGAPDGSGPQYYNADGSSTQNWNNENATYTLHAKWTPISYTVVLDKQTSAEGYGGNAGTVENQTVTFDATPATVSGTMPTAAQGYGFMGFYTATGGGGSKIINADGTWNNVSGYISGGKWIRDGGATLYAYYKKAEITAITLNSSILDPVDAGEGWVIANPTIAPTPAGTTKICWELLYDNGNSVPAGHEAQAYTEGDTKPNQVRFSITGLAAGEYKIKATLRTGDDCSGGTLLSEREVSFTIASGYTVTIQYKDTEGNTIAPSTTSPGKATDWTSISAPTIVGYNFSTWVPGDGITLESSATTNSNRFKATFNGTLTARYTKKRVIYFNNTLGWSNVYVYFYSGEYWDGNKGTGSQTGGTYTGKHGRMQPVSEGSKIYYFDAEGASVNASYTYVAFTELEQTDYQYFAETTSVKNKVAYRGDYNSTKLPMFVPLADQTPVSKNSNLANYYNEGYWMNYPENTGYTLRIYSSSGASEPTRTIRFPFSNDKKMPLKLDVEFNEAATNYYFNIYREDGTVLSAEYGMNTNWHSDVRLNNPSTKISIKTTAPGIYTFTLVYKNTPNLDYYISVDYPILENDYRISYSDNATWSQGSAHTSGWYHPSDVIRKNTDAEVTQYDTVSFYIAKGDGITASMKFQYASEIVEAGAVTWTDVAGGGITLSDFSEVITKAGVYNFIIKQEGTADPVVEKVEPYTGKFYIRTDCAGSTKWDYYRASDHEMPYTEFSMSDANSFGEKYSHYYTHWCPGGTNIKFVVANEYSSCISDTLESDLHNWGNLNDGGWLKHQAGKSETEDIYSANVRFMYNQETNKISRAYVASSTNPARKFLVLRGNQVIKGEDGSTAINDQSVTNGAILSDKENWIYERILYINPGTRFKLFACYAEADPTQSGAQYFRGAYDSDNFTTNANSVILISGTTDSYQKARVLYDFKTNRLVCAWLPSDEPIDETLNIDADVMVIRDHQEAAECITFSGDGELKKVKTVYGAMKFNRWTLNNRYRGKGGVEDNNKDHCDSPEDIAEYHGILPAGEQKSVYERSLYFISFPFDVKVSEIFGFGTYGKHWVLEYYDGLNRAKNGYWIDSPANWKYVTPSMAKTYELKAYEGYILCLSLGRMAYDNTEFWANNISNVELYFPSKTPMTNIQTTDVTIPGLSDEYRCTINRGDGTEGDRRVKDSYWRCLGVPSYDIYAGQLKAGEGGSVINWQTDYSTFPFLYAWNMNDNTLTPQSTDHFTFKPMHAYLTQIGTAIYWKNVSATPAVMARQTEEPTEYNWCLTLNAGEQMIDQTYVRMSTDEVITNEFDFGQDLSKELNTGRSDIYSFIGNERAAANSMQMNTETTTIVPLGLNIEATGEYTFSIPDGTNGIGITLIDEETGIRTSLSALDYTVELAAGTHDGRFILEISPIQNTPTGIEEPTSDSSLKGRAQKRIIDGVLYIVKDGKIFDARGTRVE